MIRAVEKIQESGTVGRKEVGIWIRVSTEDQVRGESPEHHEKRATYYAEAKGWHIVKVYHLEAVSGKTVLGHPETKQMLEDVRSGLISGLIFSKLARLARNTRELLEFADIFRDHHADLISLQESIDTTSPAGRLFYTLIAAMAQWEREEISERVAASVPIRAKLVKSLGGAAPFGYRWENKQMIPHPQEAPVRKLIYELFVEHRRLRTVARMLNERGYRTRGGARFIHRTVERILRDPTAKGVRRANYTKRAGENKAWVLKPEREWVLTSVEPIVSEEVWNQCNSILVERRRNGSAPGKKTTHLFSGYVVCQCGTKMYVPTKWPNYYCTSCRNKVPVADLEALFQERLALSVTSPEEIGELFTQADEVLQEKDRLLDALSHEQAEIRREMDKFYRLYLDDHLSPESFQQQHTPREQRLRQLNDEIPRVQAEADLLRIQHVSRQDVIDEAQDLYANWSRLTFEEKRQLVENIVDRIVVNREEITIHLAYLPPPASPSEGNSIRGHTHTDSLRRRRREPGAGHRC